MGQVQVFLLLLLIQVPEMACFLYDYGVVTPSEQYVFLNENVTLTCRLNGSRSPDTPFPHLYFKHATSSLQIPDSYVTRVDARTIKLRYPVTDPSAEGLFTCWFTRHPDNVTVGVTSVTVDHAPAPVQAVTCQVDGWQNMTCHWALPRPYRHPQHLNVSLIWTIARLSHPCPCLHNLTSCTWPTGNHSSANPFLFGHLYLLKVTVTNTVRNVSSQSEWLQVNTSEIVKPRPMKEVQRERINATCAELRLLWRLEEQVHGKVVRVQLYSQWEPSTPQIQELRVEYGSSTMFATCGLIPYTEYTARITVKPEHRGYWSQPSNLSFKTLPTAPEVAPELCASCFTRRPGDVLLCWKNIPKPQRHGILTQYQLHWTHEGSPRSLSVPYPGSCGVLPAMNSSRSYHVTVTAITQSNHSSKTASIIIPDSSTGVDPPNIIVETDVSSPWSGVFEVSWSCDSQDKASYVLVWCRGRYQTRMCDQDSGTHIEWMEMKPGAKFYRLDLSQDSPGNKAEADDYIVGLARQFRPENSLTLISSGITWAECLHHSNATSAPKDVSFSAVSSASLQVTWSYPLCSGGKVSAAYVSHFVIYYCVTTAADNSTCKGSLIVKRMSGEKRQGVLQNLEEGAVYRVSVAASLRDASQVQSPWALRTLPFATEQSSFTTVLGSGLAAVALILVIAGVIWCRRRYKKDKKKFNQDPAVSHDLIPKPVSSIYTKPEPGSSLYPGGAAHYTTPDPRLMLNQESRDSGNHSCMSDSSDDSPQLTPLLSHRRGSTSHTTPNFSDSETSADAKSLLCNEDAASLDHVDKFEFLQVSLPKSIDLGPFESERCTVSNPGRTFDLAGRTNDLAESSCVASKDGGESLNSLEYQSVSLNAGQGWASFRPAEMSSDSRLRTETNPDPIAVLSSSYLPPESLERAEHQVSSSTASLLGASDTSKSQIANYGKVVTARPVIQNGYVQHLPFPSPKVVDDTLVRTQERLIDTLSQDTNKGEKDTEEEQQQKDDVKEQGERETGKEDDQEKEENVKKVVEDLEESEDDSSAEEMFFPCDHSRYVSDDWMGQSEASDTSSQLSAACDENVGTSLGTLCIDQAMSPKLHTTYMGQNPVSAEPLSTAKAEPSAHSTTMSQATPIAECTPSSQTVPIVLETPTEQYAPISPPVPIDLATPTAKCTPSSTTVPIVRLTPTEQYTPTSQTVLAQATPIEKCPAISQTVAIVHAIPTEQYSSISQAVAHDTPTEQYTPISQSVPIVQATSSEQYTPISQPTSLGQCVLST